MKDRACRNPELLVRGRPCHPGVGPTPVSGRPKWRKLFQAGREPRAELSVHLVISLSVTASSSGNTWFRAQWLLTLQPMDYSPPGSSVHGILQAGILEGVAISSFKGSSRPRDQTHVSCISCAGRQVLYPCTTRGAPKAALSHPRFTEGKTTFACLWFKGH